MKRTQSTCLILWLATALGCGSAQKGEPREGREGKSQIAGGGAVAPPRDCPPTPVGPPTVFTPVSHPPLYRYGVAEAPDLGAMPKLTLRFDQCFGRASERRPVPIATPTSPIPGVRKAKKSPSSAPAGRGGGKAHTDDLMGSGSRSRAEVEAAPSAPKSSAPPMSPPSTAVDMVQSAPAEEMEMAADEDAAESYPEGKQRIAGGEGADPAVIASDACPEPDSDAERYDDWGQAIYLSNDDTMSLSSAQRVMYAIDHFLPLPAEHIRPHELLNYFSFVTDPVRDGYDFSVNGALAPDPREPGIYTLGLAVRGRPVDKSSRRNVALTLVVDRSGSMRDEGRMSFLKRGLIRMLDELKTGDMVHLVVFDHEICVPAENFVVGRDDMAKLRGAIDALQPRGATDLQRGLARGYEIADRAYQTGYSNRVLMVTDALTNTGVTDREMISMISKYYDTRQIHLSGVGVGREFNDALLDRLTERGKGAYVFLGSEQEVDAVFGTRFISLIETTALDVHFRLHLPPSLRMNVFYGEESSTVKEDVQEIHYFANTSQLFLSDLMARGGVLRSEDGVMLTVEYRDPESGAALQEEYAFGLGELARHARNVEKARVVMAWIDMLAQMASRPLPSGYFRGAGTGSWIDPQGWQRCEDGRAELERLASAVSDDPEVKRVLDLWNKYCARYERPRNPVRRQIAVPEDAWPGASSSGGR